MYMYKIAMFVAAVAALWIYLRQVQASGLATLQRFMEDRRGEREQVMRAHSKCEPGEELPESDAQCLQTCKHHVACDFNDMGALLFHGLAPLGAALDIWGDTILANYIKWLQNYIGDIREKTKRDRYFIFVDWIVKEAHFHKASLCGEPCYRIWWRRIVNGCRRWFERHIATEILPEVPSSVGKRN